MIPYTLDEAAKTVIVTVDGAPRRIRPAAFDKQLIADASNMANDTGEFISLLERIASATDRGSIGFRYVCDHKTGQVRVPLEGDQELRSRMIKDPTEGMISPHGLDHAGLASLAARSSGPVDFIQRINRLVNGD